MIFPNGDFFYGYWWSGLMDKGILIQINKTIDLGGSVLALSILKTKLLRKRKQKLSLYIIFLGILEINKMKKEKKQEI